jgi:hypothetical protein
MVEADPFLNAYYLTKNNRKRIINNKNISLTGDPGGTEIKSLGASFCIQGEGKCWRLNVICG